MPSGRFIAKLAIGDTEYATGMLVVPRESMTSEVILGRDFLAQVELSICRGVKTVKLVSDIKKVQSYVNREEAAMKEDNIDEESVRLLYFVRREDKSIDLELQTSQGREDNSRDKDHLARRRTNLRTAEAIITEGKGDSGEADQRMVGERCDSSQYQ